MKLSFEKAMEEHGISMDELPKDVKLMINEANDLKSRIEAKKQIGQKITPETMERLKAKDRLLVKEILDYADERDEDDDDDDDDDEEENSGSSGSNNEDDDMEEDYDDTEGVAVDQELELLAKSGVSKITLDQLRSQAPNTYNVLFDSYGQDEENGIITSNFILTEIATNSQEFKLSKK